MTETAAEIQTETWHHNLLKQSKQFKKKQKQKQKEAVFS